MIYSLILIYFRVVESLDQAMEHGYMLNDWEVPDIAVDLHDYDADFEDADWESLIPFVSTWLEVDGSEPLVLWWYSTQGEVAR